MKILKEIACDRDEWDIYREHVLNFSNEIIKNIKFVLFSHGIWGKGP